MPDIYRYSIELLKINIIYINKFEWEILKFLNPPKKLSRRKCQIIYRYSIELLKINIYKQIWMRNIKVFGPPQKIIEEEMPDYLQIFNWYTVKSKMFNLTNSSKKYESFF